MANVHDEILNSFYGCGSPIPPLLKVSVRVIEACSEKKKCQRNPAC